MEMKVHLDVDVFKFVQDGIKDIEVRVNDLKRRKLSVGDTLIFLKRPLEDEVIKKKVKALEYYSDFKEVVENYEMKRIYLENCTKEDYFKLMARFYTEEEQREFGVVAIIFE